MFLSASYNEHVSILPLGIMKKAFVMDWFRRFLLPAILCIVSCTSQPKPDRPELTQASKKYDLVLIHGLANKHKWSESFLNTCLEIWGSGRVFVVYTGKEKGVAKKELKAGVLVVGGGSGEQAGIDPIDAQAANVSHTIQTLQREYGLSEPFSVIAHSMGGLVARKYIYDNPGKVAGLVTLGTPHHGSPLAESFQWVGHFLNATQAIEDLKPDRMARFNQHYPVQGMPLAVNSTIQTIRGVPEGTDCFGWAGELLLGWRILSSSYHTRSDGLVPHESALIRGAGHIGDFPGYDHYDLVKQPGVAIKAARFLP